MGQMTRFWRPGDAAWTRMYEFGTLEIHSIAFNEGKAYIGGVKQNIIICDFNTGADHPPECTQIYRVSSVVNNLCRYNNLHTVRGVHLVACNSELLLVVLRWGSHPSLAEVYKLEWTHNKWMELRETHNKSLRWGSHPFCFLWTLATTHCLWAKETHFPVLQRKFPSIKRNCVYYADRHQKKQHWISVFHMESGVS